MSKKPTVSVVIATFHRVELIPGLFESIENQSYPVSEIFVTDNTPGDEVLNAIKKAAPQALINKPKENLDFSRSMNWGIRQASGDFVFVLNQDMRLHPDCVRELVAAMQADTHLGAASPKLLRFDEGNTIDSMGLQMTRGRRYTNIGEGESDEGQYDDIKPFGIAGTAPFFRREALQDLVTYSGVTATQEVEPEYFDDDFIAYKDDIDMSYRLRHAGWNVGVVPTAISEHVRTAQEKQQRYGAGIFKARKQKSLRIRSYSWRNHLWVLIKNEPLQNIVLHSPWILWYEMRKLAFMLLIEWSTFRAVPSFFIGLPTMLRKRRAILSNSRITAKTLRQWTK